MTISRRFLCGFSVLCFSCFFLAQANETKKEINNGMAWKKPLVNSVAILCIVLPLYWLRHDIASVAKKGCSFFIPQKKTEPKEVETVMQEKKTPEKGQSAFKKIYLKMKSLYNKKLGKHPQEMTVPA